jgi:uncharacterized protein YjbI with pentapeptide repeats
MLHTSPRREESRVDQQQQSRWRPTISQSLWTLGIGAVLTVAVLIGYRYDITLWNWLKLLIVPVVIAGGGLWFNVQQREREQRIASERAQDEALQGYLDGMSQLLTDKERPLHKAQPGDNLSTVARARTLTVLTRLDSGRKGSVLQFLYEAHLIRKDHGVFGLSGAFLSEVYLGEADLSEVDLSEARMRSAYLVGTNLTGANLSDAYLGDADLSDADLREASLLRATLMGASLDQADLSETDLSEADLSGVRLRETYLISANLSGADLSNVDLTGADLTEANLTDANITDEQLAKCNALEGATMPNGQKYEDWLKDREGREEDE